MLGIETPSEQSTQSSISTEDFEPDRQRSKVRFKEQTTIISTRRRTVRVLKVVTENEFDDELNAILSMGAMEIEPEHCKLPSLIAIVMASLLDDVAESSSIMCKTYGLPEDQSDMSQRSLIERNAQLRSHSTIFNPETLVEYAKTKEVDMIKKLHNDIVFLCHMVEKGVKSLLSDDSFFGWLMFIDHYDLQLEQDNKLLIMVENKKIKQQELKEQLYKSKIQYQIDCDNLTHDIGKARDELECFIIHADIQQDYLDKWERSRRQQNLRIKRERENFHEERIRKALDDSAVEKTVHLEISRFMDEYFQDIENSIQEWMETYDNDLEAKDEEIIKIGFKVESLGNDLKNLQEEYDKRIEQINDWLAVKADKERIEEEKRYLNRMATKIQAWWRGVMVRKKLGPYRPISKKKKKDKNKKKK